MFSRPRPPCTAEAAGQTPLDPNPTPEQGNPAEGGLIKDDGLGFRGLGFRV